MAGVDQTKGLKLLNNILKDLNIYKKGEVEGDIQDFTSIFAKAEDINGDGQIDVKEFTKALTGYAEYNFDPNSLTDEQLDEIGEDYADLYEQVFGVDGASASEISDLSKAAGDAAAAGGYTSPDTTMEDVKTRFNPTIEEANTENMSLADMKSNLATSQQALADKQAEIQETQETNEQAYVDALEAAAESNEVLAGLKDKRDEKEGLVDKQDGVIDEIAGQIDNQTSIIETQEGIISECDAIISTPIPSPVRDKEGNITNQAEIDKVKSDIEKAKAKKAEAEAAKEDAETNKLNLEEQKVTAEEQKLVLEAEILDIDNQVEKEIQNNEELSDLAEKLDTYKEANIQLMSMEADRVQLEKNINIYEKAIAEAEAAQDPVTEKEATGLREDSETLKGEDGNYQYDVKEDDTLETVVETNYDIAALVEATGLERSEVIDKLAAELNTSNAIGESGVIYLGTTLSMVDAYSVLGVEDKRPAVTEGVNPNEKRDLDDTQIDGVVDYLLGDLDIDGIDIDPKEAWNNHDFSQYTPETLAKIAAAYEEKVGAADVSFLEMAELNIEAEDKLAEIAGSMISAATNADVDPSVRARAQEMVNTHIDKAIESGDPTFLNAIINSPDEYLTDVQEFIDSNGLVDKLYESEHEEITNLRDALRAKQNAVYISPEMQEQIDKLINENQEISEEAWKSLDLSNPDAIADLQQAYDSQREAGEPTFLEKAAEMYGKSGMDDILASMDKLPENPEEIADVTVTVGGKEQTVQDVVDELQANKDFSILADLPTEDIAKIAKVYGNIDQFEFFMQQQGITDAATEYTDVRRAVEAREAEIAEREEGYEAKDAEFAHNEAVDDAYTALEEKLSAFDEENADRAELGLETADKNEVYSEIDAVMNDTSLTPEQRLDVLQKLSENADYTQYVQGYLTDSDYSQEAFVSTMLEGCSTPEEATEFANWYNGVVDPNKQGTNNISTLMTSSGNVDQLVALYENATPEQIEALNSSFNITAVLSELGNTEQAEKILDVMASSKNDVAPTMKDGREMPEELQAELKEQLIVEDKWYNNGSNKTVDGILQAYQDKTITEETAAWLLREAGYDYRELYFSDSDDAQKQLLLEIFQ